MPDVGIDLNELELRVAALEQFTAGTITGQPDSFSDIENMVTVVNDPLDWSVANNGWESYTQVGPPIIDPTDDYYPGGVMSTPYGMAAAYQLGSMCVLTGMVRRKAGAANLVAGTAYNLPMFNLPMFWQPTSDIILPCLMGSADPTGNINVVGVAWIEIRENSDEDTATVYFRAGTVGCAANTGWVALQGLFPISVADAPATVENSWDDASETTTWDSLDNTITWNSYPNPAS